MPCMIANFVPYIDWKIRKLHPQKITFYSGNSYCNKYLFWLSSSEVKSGRNANELLWFLGMKIDSFGKFKVWIEYWFVHFNENYLIQRSSILKIPKGKLEPFREFRDMELNEKRGRIYDSSIGLLSKTDRPIKIRYFSIDVQFSSTLFFFREFSIFLNFSGKPLWRLTNEVEGVSEEMHKIWLR